MYQPRKDRKFVVTEYLSRPECRLPNYVDPTRPVYFNETLETIRKRVEGFTRQGWEILPPISSGFSVKSRDAFFADLLPDSWSVRIFNDIYLFRGDEGSAALSALWAAALYQSSRPPYPSGKGDFSHYLKHRLKEAIPGLIDHDQMEVEAMAVMWHLSTPPMWLAGCVWTGRKAPGSGKHR